MKGKWNFLQKLGFLMVLASFAWLLGSELLAMRNQSAARELAQQIESLIPPASQGYPQDHSDPAMPVLQLDGEDFSALIRVPSYGIFLPVAHEWQEGAVSSHPRRFMGSVYDGSLILGGSDQQGQFAFCGQMDLGDKIVITDMTGAEFSYQVARIDRRKQADVQSLSDAAYELTLFVREETSLNYIVVRCILSL